VWVAFKAHIGYCLAGNPSRRGLRATCASYTLGADPVRAAASGQVLSGRACCTCDMRFDRNIAAIKGIAHDQSSKMSSLSATDCNTRDASGNPTSISDWDDPAGRAYDYDNNNRLASAAGTDYNYDWVGNRLNPPVAPDPMEYNAADQLTRWPTETGKPGHQYDYLGTGSLEHQYDDDSPRNLEKTYAYTPADLLSSVTHVGASSPVRKTATLGSSSTIRRPASRR
jgi:hypothetical protein